MTASDRVVIARSQRTRAKSRGPMTGSATKQSTGGWTLTSEQVALDCFAPLAMTVASRRDELLPVPDA
jgi:hypothetical protein